MDFQKIDSYIAEKTNEYLEDLRVLISYDSEYAAHCENAPFGETAAACLKEAETIAQGHGFSVTNYDNYVVAVDFDPTRETGLDILAHLDVVPAGNGWTVTDPFTMKIVGDKVYGRGTIDDKGPGLCALYAMKAIKDCGIKLKKNVRLILGSDEECGSRDLAHYFKTEKSAPYSLSPDANFPLINIEKGGLHITFTSNEAFADTLPRVTAINGGVKINVVPESATALIEGLSAAQITEIGDSLIAGTPAMAGCSFSCEDKDGAILVTAHGKNAHASTPHEGVNAITGLLALIKALPLADCTLHTQLKALADLFPHGDIHGKGLGVDMWDDVSGHTTLTLDLIQLSEQGFSAAFDCRACLSANDDNTTAVVRDKLANAGFAYSDNTMFAPHYVPEDSFLVTTLMGIYNEMTSTNSKPICIGGGTYVHHIEGGVAFGCCQPGLDNHLHGADEFMTLEQIDFTTKIYARSILAVCGVEE